jgi:branched-chain amino acid transport system substrate-binding protein
MKQNTTRAACAAVLAAAMLGAAGEAAAQKISDDVIRIGLIDDLSGLYADVGGVRGVEAIKMAIADAKGQLFGKKIELVVADHQNKADIGASKAREWFDQGGVDMLIGGSNSAVSLAMSKVAAEKHKPFIAIGAASARLTNEDCTPYTMHYAYDTVALAKGTGGALVEAGGKTWYFLTADYAFGASLQNDTSDVIKAKGGQVLGSVKHPINASDFSSFLLQAQASKAQILGLANAGGDTINSIKAANEFGVTKTMKLAGLLMFISDVHSLGLDLTHGMYLTTGFYWDLNDETRAWSKRFFEATHREPTMVQAAYYSSTRFFLEAVEAAKTDDADAVMTQMKKLHIHDFFAKDGYIRADGRMIHDMYLVQVKDKADSKYPWDYYKIVKTIPGEEAYTALADSKCSLVKK